MAGKVETITIKVERKSQYGLLFQNNWFSISKFGEASLDQFEAGRSYIVVVSYSKEGKPYIDKLIGPAEAAAPVPTAAPSQGYAHAPVQLIQPVAKPSPEAHVSTVDSLTVRDIYMAAQAAMKSTLESPTVHYLATTMKDEDVPALIRQYMKLGVELVLETVAEKKG